MGFLNAIKGLFNNNRAKQITIHQLNEALLLLENGETEYDFIGITSNGADCIYFVKDNGKFNIEFEALTEEQLPYVDKLKIYADSKKFRYNMASHGNKPDYKSLKNAPVIRIETNTNLMQTAEIAQEIQSVVFGNIPETKYDIVP